MDIDPKLTAAKVYPIDRIREEYDEPDEPSLEQLHRIGDTDPVYRPRDFLIDVCGVAFGAAVLTCFLLALFHHP